MRKEEREGERRSKGERSEMRGREKLEAVASSLFPSPFPPAQREANPRARPGAAPRSARDGRSAAGGEGLRSPHARTALLGCSRPRGHPRASTRGRGRPPRCADGTCPFPTLPPPLCGRLGTTPRQRLRGWARAHAEPWARPTSRGSAARTHLDTDIKHLGWTSSRSAVC